MGNNNTRTRAFDVVKNGSDNNRRKMVIAIFVVIALILAAFATLIIGKLINELPLINPGVPSNGNLNYIPLYAEDIKKGNLLIVNDQFKYDLPTNFSHMVNVYEYINSSKNSELTKINGYFTYLSHTPIEYIYVESTTLDAFSKMLLDYCKANVNSTTKHGVSNISITWGGYAESTKNEYQGDVSNPNFNGEYYDHGLGTSLVLRISDTAVVITEQILKDKYLWIYENAHKYGFIIRYPNACKDHTGKDSTTRAHLRYIGVEHATYMYENNICLEEYIDLLKTKHNSVNTPLSVETENGNYDIYYIQFNGNHTSVPVPKGAKYTISGDNMNGFIVSVEK